MTEREVECPLCAPVPSGVTEAMVERFIAAMDVASDADVGREEGIRYALSAALVEAQASRAAARAAQEVERERDRAITMSDQSRAKWADADSRNTALTAQLAAVTQERDAVAKQYREAWQSAEAEIKRLHGTMAERERGAAREALVKFAEWQNGMANVRDNMTFFSRTPASINAECARDADVFRGREYPALDPVTPAFPSGAAKWDISEPRNPATPSAEAREVPSEVVVSVEHCYGEDWWRTSATTRVRISPADAKRIVAMAQEAE